MKGVPHSPDDVAAVRAAAIPPYGFDAVNELLAERAISPFASVRLSFADIRERVLAKRSRVDHADAAAAADARRKLLCLNPHDIRAAYMANGWYVELHPPTGKDGAADNEAEEGGYVFTRGSDASNDGARKRVKNN